MEHLLGLLKIRVLRGTNLAVRDLRSSDPYVVIEMGQQILKTHEMKKNINPEWNEELTLSIADPNLPIRLTVYDKDTFTIDDKMGDAEFDVEPFIEALKMHPEDQPNGSTIVKVQPSKQNCIAKESCIVWSNGKLVQDICLRLRNVECGEVELELQWINLHGSREK